MKPILKSNSALIAIGNNPSWTTGVDYGRLLSLVQGSNYSVSIPRQTSKSVGSDMLFLDDISYAPEVEIQIQYNLSPFLNNEFLFGLKSESAAKGEYSAALETMASQNNNIYLLIEEQDGDAFDRPKNLQTDLSGFSAVNCGNCFMKSYSVNWSVGQIPQVSTSFDAVNMEFQKITGSLMPIPAINLASGNQDQRGNLAVDQLYLSLPSGFIIDNAENRTEYSASTALASASRFDLQNLQCGGVNILNSDQALLQSFNISLDLQRTPMYGLGSNYVFGRKLLLPALGTASVTAIASGISSGEFTSMLTGESSYSFEIAFSDEKKLTTGLFSIEGAKLQSLSLEMGVNDSLNFSAQFSFAAYQSGGFLIKRDAEFEFEDYVFFNGSQLSFDGETIYFLAE